MTLSTFVSGLGTIGGVVANTNADTNEDYLFISCLIDNSSYIFQLKLADGSQTAFNLGNSGSIGLYGNYIYSTYMNDNAPNLGRLLFNYTSMTPDSLTVRFNSISFEEPDTGTGPSTRTEFIDNPVDVVGVDGYVFYIHSSGYISRFTIANISDYSVNDEGFGSASATEYGNAGYRDLGGALTGASPSSLASDGSTYVYIGCSTKIVRMSLDGTSYSAIVTGLSSAVSALSVSGDYLYALLADDTVLKINLTDFTSSELISSGLTSPNSIVNSGDYLYICDGGSVLRSTLTAGGSSDTTLTTFTVDGSAYDTTVAAGTTSINVVAEPTDPNVLSVTIASDVTNAAAVTSAENYTRSVDLNHGVNTITVVVTAQDGTTQTTYTLTVTVTPSTVTTLSNLTVHNNSSLANGFYVYADAGTSQVGITATPTDTYATVTINGTAVTGATSYYMAVDVYDGENYITITVTAEDGTTYTDYSGTVYVTPTDNGGGDGGGGGNLSNDASISLFQVNYTGVSNNNVSNGQTVTTTSGITSVSVTAYPTNGNVQYVKINDVNVYSSDSYTGSVDVSPGTNTISISVLAEDGTPGSYSVTVYVPSNDTSVTVSVGDIGVVSISDDAFTSTLTAYTTSVLVSAVKTDTNATVIVSYGMDNSSDSLTLTNMNTGNNTVTIVVTAEDTSVVRTITGTIYVPSNDTTLSTFTVNGGDNLNSGDTKNISSGTTSVTVIAYPTDVNVSSITIASSESEATTVSDYSVGVDVDVVNGSNTITVVVTAEDGTTTQTYTVYAYVYSNVVTLSVFTIEGVTMGTSGGGSINLPYGTTSADVSVTTTSSVAYITLTTANYTGGQYQTSHTYTVTGLTTGSNTVTVRIDAEDENANATYTATINVQSETTTTITCFEENTKILCFNNETSSEEYVTIKDLRKGDLVKTVSSGYKAINMIGKRDIYHPSVQERIKNQLYKCSTEKYPELFEDLIITGCHSILVKEFASNEEKEKTIEINGNTYVTEKHYRLPACADERASVYEEYGNYTIYHIALDNEDYYMNYGVYANGLLVETSSQRYLKELSGMELIE